jgi:hypothetical protein
MPGNLLAKSTLAFSLILTISFHTVSASIILNETFNSEPGSGDGKSGRSGISYNSFANWTISGGTVDLVEQGDFAPGPGILCVDNIGKCVDLDGSTKNSGMMTSVALPLAAGRYSLTYELAGVDVSFAQSAAGIPNTVDISVQPVDSGISFFIDQQVRNQGDFFSLAGGTFDVAFPTTVEILFQDRGNDNFGAVLDNVTLSAVPAPPTIALLLGGVLSFYRFNRTARHGNSA